MPAPPSRDRPHEPEFVPISPNPYIVGNPVRDRAMFFGREAEFELVRKRFQNSTHGGLLVFCGERRSGKTSILFQILDQRLGPDFIPVLIDMQSMAIGSEIDFLAKIADEVIAALGSETQRIQPPSFVSGSNHSATFQKFIQDVLRAHPGRKLILLFDEYELFENKIDSGTLAQDTLYVLSNLMENQSVFLIFTGSQHLEQRRREYWKILGKSLYKTISYLERDDAVKLVRKPVEGRVHYEDGAVEVIYRLTAGQAFYTQAICQSLIDHLNEQKVTVATVESLSTVINALVNNPLPQMIFMWDELGRDEKLVLSLLAESLLEEQAWAGTTDVTRLVGKREYPLELGKPRISTVLEKLFKAEMLLRDDSSSLPRYAFRMDLWRLWIRRMHSVWQVMREEGLEIRQNWWSRLGGRRWAIAGSLAFGVLLINLGTPWLKIRRAPAPPGPAAPTALLDLQVTPDNAVLFLEGRKIGIGSFRDTLPSGVDHHFRITAPGHADTAVAISLTPGIPKETRIALRPFLGALRIETRPPGADVTVDGELRGRSPVSVTGLAVAQMHVVAASLSGHAQAQGTYGVATNSVTPVSLTLAAGSADVRVVTDPAGALVSVDGNARGKSPLHLRSQGLGRHTFSARREGYVAAETTLTVSEATHDIEIVLAPQPPGVLVVQGDRPAQIYLDGVLIVENVQNSGPRELDAGDHQVRVVLTSGETIDYSVEVRPRERATYDYSRGAVTRRPQGGRP